MPSSDPLETEASFRKILTCSLEKRGLVHVSKAPAGAKSRRGFQATTAGREVTTRNALALITELRVVPHPLLVGLANLALLSEPEYAEALRSRLAQVEARIAAAERQWVATRVQVPDDTQD